MGSHRLPFPMSSLIELRAITFAYTNSSRLAAGAHAALCGIDLCINSGARMAVVGANGAGKSTLLGLLNGSLRPASGNLRYRGKEVEYSRRSLAELRQRVAFVLQDPDDQLFAGTIRQDVSFGPLNLGLTQKDASLRVDAALAAMEILDLADSPPHQLSHGQRKRAAIAGALAMHPEVLVLDEPTAGLDPRGIASLDLHLHQLSEHGMTIVLTTHDIDFAFQWADEVVVMQNGRITHTGSPDSVLANEENLKNAGLRVPIELAIRRALKNASRPAWG